jgi:transcriptional regulator with XRE-family HTH domain
MNPIRQVIEEAKSSQKEVCEILGINQSTLSARMLKEVKGSIEWSIEVAKELNLKKYTIVKDGCVVSVKLNIAVVNYKPQKCKCRKSTFTRTVDADFNCLCGKCGHPI